jgi:hypothetical protein
VNVTLNAMLKPNVAFKSKRCIEECWDLWVGAVWGRWIC